MEMKFVGRAAEHTHFLSTKEIKKILEELKVEPVDEKLRRYKTNWLRHAKITKSSSGMPKIMLNFRLNEQRRFERFQ